jgi:hypothetical protein
MRRERSLLESLKEDALEASYRDRVHGRLTARRRDGLGNLQRELLAEMASALGRAEARVLESLAELRRVEAELIEIERGVQSGTRERSEIEPRFGAFEACYAVAERRLWELMVHREALGLFRHDVLARHYSLPPKRRRPKASAGV